MKSKNRQQTIMRMAHSLTKVIIRVGDSYHATLGLVLKKLYNQFKTQTIALEKELIRIDNETGEVIHHSKKNVLVASIYEVLGKIDSHRLNLKKRSNVSYSETCFSAVGRKSSGFFHKGERISITTEANYFIDCTKLNEPKMKRPHTYKLNGNYDHDYRIMDYYLQSKKTLDEKCIKINEFCNIYTCFDSSRFDKYFN